MSGTTTKPRAAKADPARNRLTPELFDLPIDRIDGTSNVRTAPGNGDLEELAASIREHGVLSPIRVELAGAREGTARYALVYGQRRLAAAKLAGLATIPALVDVDNRTGAVLMVEQLVENLQRADLNPLEEAAAYRTLLDTGLSQRQLAKELGRSQPSIADKLRLLKLPDPVRERIAAGELSASHAKALAALPDTEIEEVARRVVEHKLSAHDVEREVRLALDRVTEADRRRDEDRIAREAIWPRLLEKLDKAGIQKVSATLVVEDKGLAERLHAEGWTLSAKRGTSLYGNVADDCAAWEVAWSAHWGATYGPDLRPMCLVPAHAKAREERIKQSRADQQQAQAAREAKASEARALATVPIVERLTADPELRARLVLDELLGPYGGDAVGAFFDEIKVARYGGSNEARWTAIAALSASEVERWTIAILADQLADDDKMLTAVLGEAQPKGKAKS